MILQRFKRSGNPPDMNSKLTRPANRIYYVLKDTDAVLYEYDFKARLRWRRNDLCSACLGLGYTGQIQRDALGGFHYFYCFVCNGTGRTKDRLDYNSGHREI